MDSSSHVRNIAIVGASGNIGGFILQALHSTGRFNLTAVSRSTSGSYPNGVKLVSSNGDYTTSFLQSAFKNQDAIVLAVGFPSIGEPQISLVNAAAAAGVKYIVPAEFGSDLGHAAIKNLVPLYGMKHAVRARIEELGRGKAGPKYIGVISNPWLVNGINTGIFNINPKAKTATIIGDGNVRFTTSTMAQVGRAIAGLFSLPESSTTGPSISDYGNKFVYLSSFAITQRELLEEIIKCQGSKQTDWSISTRDAGDYIAAEHEKLAKGDFSGMRNLIGVPIMQEGMGGDVSIRNTYLNKVLNLPEESLEAAVKEALVHDTERAV